MRRWNTNADRYGNDHPRSVGYADRHGHGYGLRNAHGNSDGYRLAYAAAFTDAETASDTGSSSYTQASPFALK